MDPPPPVEALKVAKMGPRYPLIELGEPPSDRRFNSGRRGRRMAAPAVESAALQLPPADTRGKHRILAELKRLDQEARFLEVCSSLLFPSPVFGLLILGFWGLTRSLELFLVFVSLKELTWGDYVKVWAV